ncbi:J domain-containing protein [Halopiger thermotolerans]
MSSATTDGGSRLDWPADFGRTDPDDRSPNNNFDVTLSKAFSDLETQLDRLDVEEFRYSFDARQRKKDKRPYSRANPDDPGFVLRWTMDGNDYAVACDRYSRLRDNVRAVGLYLKEKRKMENRPVTTGQSEFATARLPPADGEAIAAPPVQSDDVLDEDPHEVLDVAPDAPDEIVKAAFRAQVKDLEGHPDTGGSSRRFQKLKRARDELLED